MKTNEVSLTFNGTDAAVWLCIGFIPDNVEIRANEDATDLARVFWSRGHRAAESVNGFLLSEADLQLALYTAGEGVEPYEGGDVMDAVNQTSVAYGEGIYLKKDPIVSYHDNTTYGFDDKVTTWTLDTSATRKGHFDQDSVASGGRCGEGSVVMIRETSTGLVKRAIIEAMTADQGSGTDEVTLSRAIGSGTIESISGMYDMIPVPLGEKAPAGIKLNPAAAAINANDEMQEIIAKQYEN